MNHPLAMGHPHCNASTPFIISIHLAIQFPLYIPSYKPVQVNGSTAVCVEGKQDEAGTF